MNETKTRREAHTCTGRGGRGFVIENLCSTVSVTRRLGVDPPYSSEMYHEEKVAQEVLLWFMEMSALGPVAVFLVKPRGCTSCFCLCSVQCISA